MVHILQKKWSNNDFNKIDKDYLKSQCLKITVPRERCECHPSYDNIVYKIELQDWMIKDYKSLCEYYCGIRPHIKEIFNGGTDTTWLLLPIQNLLKAIIDHPEFLAFRQRYPWN